MASTDSWEWAQFRSTDPANSEWRMLGDRAAEYIDKPSKYAQNFMHFGGLAASGSAYIYERLSDTRTQTRRQLIYTPINQTQPPIIIRNVVTYNMTLTMEFTGMEDAIDTATIKATVGDVMIELVLKTSCRMASLAKMVKVRLMELGLVTKSTPIQFNSIDMKKGMRSIKSYMRVTDGKPHPPAQKQTDQKSAKLQQPGKKSNATQKSDAKKVSKKMIKTRSM